MQQEGDGDEIKGVEVGVIGVTLDYQLRDQTGDIHHLGGGEGFLELRIEEVVRMPSICHQCSLPSLTAGIGTSMPYPPSPSSSDL